MKRMIALLLVMVVGLSLAACGSGESETEQTSQPAETVEEATAMTKEEMQAQAVDVDVVDINNQAFENLARVKMNYCNKILNLKGTIESIEEDHVVLGCSSSYVVDVYLPLEEIVMLEVGQSVLVVGQTSDEIVDTADTIAEYTFEYTHFQMPAAYLVQDRFEFTGVLKGESNSYAPAFNIQIGTSNYLKLITFVEGVDTSAFAYNQEITFTAKAIKGSLDWGYYEAEIVE